MKRKIIVGIIILTLFSLIGSRIYQNIVSKKLKGEIIANIQSGETDLSALTNAYPDVSSSYLNTLYNQTKSSSDSGMSDEEFTNWLNS